MKARLNDAMPVPRFMSSVGLYIDILNKTKNCYIHNIYSVSCIMPAISLNMKASVKITQFYHITFSKYRSPTEVFSLKHRVPQNYLLNPLIQFHQILVVIIWGRRRCTIFLINALDDEILFLSFKVGKFFPQNLSFYFFIWRKTCTTVKIDLQCPSAYKVKLEGSC